MIKIIKSIFNKKNIDNTKDKEIFELNSYIKLSWELKKIKEIWIDMIITNTLIGTLDYYKNWIHINIWEFNLYNELLNLKQEFNILINDLNPETIQKK